MDRPASRRYAVLLPGPSRASRCRPRSVVRYAAGALGFGYNLYITRAESWLDAADQAITEAEWHAVVAGDPSLTINTASYVDQKVGGIIKRTHPVEWSGSSDGNAFWYDGGAIECKNPTELWRRKMVELAAQLSARVLGEEDEEYP